jgi:hypothetical protein
MRSRELRWVGHVACMMKETDAYNVLVVRPEGRRPFVKPKRRWGDNIEIYHKKIECVWTR